MGLKRNQGTAFGSHAFFISVFREIPSNQHSKTLLSSRRLLQFLVRMGEPSMNLYCSNDDKNLGSLFEAFGSKVSVEDMTEAYCQAGRDVYKAGEILYNLLGSSSGNSTPVSNDISVRANASLAGASDTLMGKSCGPKSLSQFKAGNHEASVDIISGVNDANHARLGTSVRDAQQNPIQSKPRNRGVSMGTVSDVIDPRYARSINSTDAPREKPKPVKLMSTELPASELWGETVQPKTETMKYDVEDFVLKMLGDGFQLDVNTIKEVVGECGYDVRETVAKLMDISAPTLDLADATSSAAVQTPMEKCHDVVTQNGDISSSRDYAGSFKTTHMAKNEPQRHKKVSNGSNLEKDVLSSLFTAPKRIEVRPRQCLARRQTRTKYGLVTGPLEDPRMEFSNPIVKMEVNGNGNEDDEDNYEALREAMKEYWETAKTYFLAATDAYVQGNNLLQEKLSERGIFFLDKARETNALSAKKLLETRDDGSTIRMDIHDCEAGEAVRLLMTQLKCLSGIRSIHFLKVVVGSNEENTKHRTCKRKRMIGKLLEKDGIEWSEEEDGKIIMIRVDKINPKRLSFNQK